MLIPILALVTVYICGKVFLQSIRAPRSTCVLFCFQADSENPDECLVALQHEFGIDLMDTFQFICRCFGDPKTCPQNGRFVVLLSRLELRQKDCETQK